MILENYINLEVNSFFRAGTIDQKIRENAFSDKIDVVQKIEECDVVLGNYNIRTYLLQNLPLQNTEQVVYDIGEKLINSNFASGDDIYDIRSILEYISGSAGYKRAHTLVKELNIVSLNLLISWMYIYSRFRFSSIQNLQIVLSPENHDHKNMKIADILDYYFLEHQSNGELVNINATVIPSYYWMQKIKEERKP